MTQNHAPSAYFRFLFKLKVHYVRLGVLVALAAFSRQPTTADCLPAEFEDISCRLSGRVRNLSTVSCQASQTKASSVLDTSSTESSTNPDWIQQLSSEQSISQ